MKRFRQLLAVCGCLLFPAAGYAEEEQDKPRLTLAPYIWAPNLEGSVSLGPLSVPVDLRVVDIAGGITAGGMGYAQFGNQRKFIYAEAIAMGFNDKQFAPFFDQAVKGDIAFIEVGAGLHRSVLLGEGSVLHISPYTGLRYLAVKASVSGSLLIAKANNRSFDPVIGMIVEAPISDRFTLLGKLDGAGLGLTSNEYVSVAGLVQYRVSSKLSIAAGYRYARADLPSTQNLGLSLNARGPVIGLRFQTPVSVR